MMQYFSLIHSIKKKWLKWPEARLFIFWQTSFWLHQDNFIFWNLFHVCQFGGTCRKYLRKRRLKKGENQWEKKWAERNDEQQKRNLQRKESFWDIPSEYAWNYRWTLPTHFPPSSLSSFPLKPTLPYPPIWTSKSVFYWLNVVTQMSFATTHYLDNRGNLPGGWSWKDTFMVTCLKFRLTLHWPRCLGMKVEFDLS